MHAARHYNIFEVERLLTTPFAGDYADESITLSDLRTCWKWDPVAQSPAVSKNPGRSEAEDDSLTTSSNSQG